MGKNKQPTTKKIRTKGNIKPSNSERATEFLQRNASAGALSGLGLFITGIPTTDISMGFSSLLPLDQDPAAATLDTDFLSTLRRLEKRNSATKQKALDSFLSLLNDKVNDNEYVKSDDVIAASVLPFWARIYSALTFDDDRRVRELAQLAMHALAKRLGRKLAPSLKELVVPWTFGVVDFYENTSKAAQAGLNDTFPGPKRGELYRRYAKVLLDECEKRITHLSTNLPVFLKLNSKKRRDDVLSPEAHHHLDLASQFLAWTTSLLPELSQLPADNPQLDRLQKIIGQKLWPSITPIVEQVKFTPLSKAYFGLMGALCETMTAWILQPEQKPLFDFVVNGCVKSTNNSPERLAAAAKCLSLFGEEIWKQVSWTELVQGTFIPMLEQAQTKAQRQAVYGNLLSLTSQLPIPNDSISDTDCELLEKLVSTALGGLLRSLNLAPDCCLSNPDASGLTDQGSSVDCLQGTMELARYLLDRAALTGCHRLVDFLLQRVFLDLVVFAFASEGITPKRWINHDRFVTCLFKQVCSTLVHLVHDPRDQLQAVFSSLQAAITDSVKLESPPLTTLLRFIELLTEAGKDATTGSLEAWCQAWLLSLLTRIYPKTGSEVDSATLASLWLLSFSLVGHLEGAWNCSEEPFTILLSTVIPHAPGGFKWTDAMSKGLAVYDLKPVPGETFLAASERTRSLFLSGPVRKLVPLRDLEGVLKGLVDTTVENIERLSGSLLELAEIILTVCSSHVSEYLLSKVYRDLAESSTMSRIIYEFLSSFVDLLISTSKLSLPWVEQLINRYAELTLVALWHGEQDVSAGSEIVKYLSTLSDPEAIAFSQKIWTDLLAKLKTDGCPNNSAKLLAFLRQLSLSTEVSSEAWLAHISSEVSSLSQELDSLSQGLPIFVLPEVFAMRLLPRLAPLIVALQLGLKLNLQKPFQRATERHKELANILLTVHYWLVAGTIEPYHLSDLSSNYFFMPTNAESSPSRKCLLSYLDGMCSEIVDTAYSRAEMETPCVALRGVLARHLVGVHPLQWPLKLRELASCSPPDTWFQNTVEGSRDAFLLVCETCIPAGVLCRCLPRSQITNGLMELVSNRPEDREVITRVLEIIACLSSVAFVGGAYAFTLAPLVLDDVLHEFLVSIDDLENCGNLEMRAVTSAQKSLQALMLLRQPAPPLGPDLSHLGLVVQSLRLKHTKPRLTREQWDRLLCITATWVTMAVPEPQRSTAFGVHTFRLVAAIGALFVNSLCSSATVTGALIQRGDASTVDELMNMSKEEWDETDFDFAGADYDCVDDGSVAAPPDDLFDTPDESGADTEESRFEDPNAMRRLPPPASVQKDWREFFAMNIFKALISLAADTCLTGRDAEGAAMRDTPVHLSALCAAVATCSVEGLLETIEDEADIVALYLLDSSISQNEYKAPQVENNLFATQCSLAPQMRNAINLTMRLLSTSQYQSGQLLGHILLTRLVSSRSLEPVRRMSDALIAHLPPSWVAVLASPLTEPLERLLGDAHALVAQWGRGLVSVESLLDDREKGHQRVLAYLLAWDGLVSLLASASQQSRAGFQAALLHDPTWVGHLTRLILTLGLLLPAQSEIQTLVARPCRLEPDRRLLLPHTNQEVKPSAQNLETLFAPVEESLLHLPGHRLVKDLSHMAVRLLVRLLAQTPALIRALQAELQRGAAAEVEAVQLTAGQARQLAGQVERVVRRHISAYLVAAEVEAVERRAVEFQRRLGTTPLPPDGEMPDAGAVVIRGRPLLREVSTTYYFALDQAIEMVIRLPENYPLAPVEADMESKTDAIISRWISHIVHLKVFLNNQNGSILEGIGLWLRNLKKKFDGVEDCAICYSVIHDRDFSFPRMQCRVCKKRFHHECMFRYFQVSLNPYCPLCRSHF